jgi:hypothetical protein
MLRVALPEARVDAVGDDHEVRVANEASSSTSA